jgi:hypothetical protein
MGRRAMNEVLPAGSPISRRPVGPGAATDSWRSPRSPQLQQDQDMWQRDVYVMHRTRKSDVYVAYVHVTCGMWQRNVYVAVAARCACDV